MDSSGENDTPIPNQPQNNPTPDSSPRPCTFKPECPDQCPDLAIDPNRLSHCVCGHLASLHRPAPIVPVQSTSSSLITHSKWREAIDLKKSKGKGKTTVSAARLEALSGYRPKQSDIPRAEPNPPKGKFLLYPFNHPFRTMILIPLVLSGSSAQAKQRARALLFRCELSILLIMLVNILSRCVSRSLTGGILLMLIHI